MDTQVRVGAGFDLQFSDSGHESGAAGCDRCDGENEFGCADQRVVVGKAFGHRLPGEGEDDHVLEAVQVRELPVKALSTGTPHSSVSS